MSFFVFQVPLCTTQDWINFVPCPPPNMFSLLCLEVSECDLLMKILHVCLSQYESLYGQGFTDDMKCSGKETCQRQRESKQWESCDFDEKINVTCYWSTDSTTADVTTVTSTTRLPSTTNLRTTTQTTEQTTEQTTANHVTDFKSTLPNITMEQNYSMFTTVNPAILDEPSKSESSSFSTIIALLIVLFILCVHVFPPFYTIFLYFVFSSPVFLMWMILISLFYCYLQNSNRNRCVRSNKASKYMIKHSANLSWFRKLSSCKNINLSNIPILFTRDLPVLRLKKCIWVYDYQVVSCK